MPFATPPSSSSPDQHGLLPELSYGLISELASVSRPSGGGAGGGELNADGRGPRLVGPYTIGRTGDGGPAPAELLGGKVLSPLTAKAAESAMLLTATRF